ncbi:MAG: hypothetical protein R3B48_27120 [Kofleriaceae bacterium]
MRRNVGWVCAISVASFGLRLGVAAASPDAALEAQTEEEPSRVRVSVDYQWELERSQLVRESVGQPSSGPVGAIPVQRDLDSSHARHTITPRLELSLIPGVWLSAALPLVAADDHSLSLHDGVDRATSSTLLDGLLPSDGFDAQNPTRGFADGDMLFRSRRRRGLDQVFAGAGVALMDQARDPHKPTWVLGAEVGLAVGQVAKFDAMEPSANEGVGRGVHELHLWTSVARRSARLETTFGIGWRAPFATKSDSPFRDLGYGITNVLPQQEAELTFSLAATALDRPAAHRRIDVRAGARVKAHFEGRGYSELWEVFALAGDARVDGAPLILDRDPVTADTQALSHPGITNLENSLDLGANLGVQAKLGAHVELALTAEVVWKTDHAITFADAGIDLPTCAAGQTTGCELANNDLIDAGTEEENPAFVSRIDLVGHRYRSTEGFGAVLGVRLGGSF